MSGAQIHVRLFRDSFNTPWGFRLQGGKDVSQVLSIQRVFSNSPAEGELQRGDIILQIGDKRAQDLTHKQAQDLIKFGGGQINLVIQRPPSGHVAPLTPRPHQVQAPTFRQPQQPPMPSPGGQNYGFSPKKVTLSKLGGGGPNFGSDYTNVPVQRGYQPMSAMVQQQQQQQQQLSPGGGYQMLNRVQESLDTIIQSPRTPEPPYSSAPFYQQQQPAPSQPPTYQGYIPTHARIEMQQQQQNRQEQLQYSQGEDDYPIEPVWERRKLFMEQPRMAAPPPKAPKPRRIAGPAYPVKAPSFGVDYAAPKASSQHTWKPATPTHQPMAHAPPHIHPQGPAEGGAAPWRDTLKTTGVKPWDKELQYTVEPAPAPAPSTPRYQPPPGPAGNFQVPNPDDQEDGPKVVHLQYNSPMGLYSNQNIQETYEGQTKALATQGAAQPQNQQNKQGERDWSQSSVYRMIKEQETRRTTTTSTFSPSVPVGQQQQSYRRPTAPDDEIGISDF